MKYFRSIVWVILACFYVSVGTAQIEDSVRAVLDNPNISDTLKKAIRFELAVKYQRTRPERTLIYGRELMHAPGLDDSVEGALYNLLGIAHISLGTRDSALYYHHRALEVFQRIDNKIGIAETANNLGRFYRKDNFDEAIKFYDKALVIYLALNAPRGVAAIWNESGVAFEYAGNYDSARARYERSLAICIQEHDTIGMAYALEFISGVLALQDSLESALQYNLKAIGLREQIQDSFGICVNMESLASIYYRMGKYELAARAAHKSREYAHRMNYIYYMPAIYQLLRDIATATGNIDSALYYAHQYDFYKDSVFKLDRNRQVEMFTVLYDLTCKESLIQQQQFELTQKNYILLGSLGIIVAGVFIGGLYYKRNQLLQKNMRQEAQIAQQKAVSKAIVEAEEEERRRIARDLHDGVGQMMSAARMNLSLLMHDIGESIQEEYQSQLNNIINIVDESCKEIRAVSHQMMPNSLIKNSLSIALRNFIDKLDFRVLDIHLYTEGLDQRLDLNIESVFYRVIQECVNNVIKHAQADRLDITVIRNNEEIVASIEDNGIGFDIGQIGETGGIGLKNIKTRIAYLQGHVEFDSAPGRGTVVMIHVPIQPETDV